MYNKSSDMPTEIESSADLAKKNKIPQICTQPHEGIDTASDYREESLAVDGALDEEWVDIRPSEVKPPIAYWDFYQRTSKISWQAAASYTFSLQMVVLTYLLSRLDNDNNQDLAAVTLISTVINSTVIVGIAPLLAMGLSVSKDIGTVTQLEARDQRKRTRGELSEDAENSLLPLKRQIISGVLRNGMIVGTASSVVFMIPVMVGSEFILTHLFFQDSEIAKIAQDFIRPYAFAIPGIMTRVATDQVLYAFERTKPAMIIGLASFSFWMPLSIYLAFGTPNLGATGLLIGCGLDGYTTSLGYAAYLAYSPRFIKYNFFDFRQPWLPEHIEQMKIIRGLGRSILLSIATETAMTVAMSVFAGAIGVEQQAAFSVIMQVSLLTLLLQISFGQTSSQNIGQYIGRNEFENASRAAKIGLAAMLSYIAPVLILFAAYPDMLLSIQKNNDHSFTHTIKTIAPIIFIGLLLDATRFQLLQQLRSLGAAKQASTLSCSAIALGILLSGVLGLETDMGIYGVATGFAASTGLATLGLSSLWLNKVQPDAIAHTKNHPEQFVSLNLFSVFTKKRNANHNSSVEMIENPVHSKEPPHEAIAF